MLSDDPKLVGSRLSVLLGNPVQQTPQHADHTPTTTATTAAITTTPPSQSRQSSARNSSAMGYPIYEPQSQRPYTPETEPELDDEADALEFSQHPAPPILPTTPAPVHINPSSSLPSEEEEEEERQRQREQSIPPPPPPEPTNSTSSPIPASTPTLNGTPNTHTPLYSSKPSFQSHRTISSTSSSFIPTSDLEHTHTSTNPFSPFYRHPTTRTSLEVDRAGIKALSPSSRSASKTAIITIHPVHSTNGASASDLDASLSSLNPPSYPPSHPSSTYERTRRQRESCTVYPHRYSASRRYGSNGLPIAFTTRPGNGNGSAGQSCELLRLECEKRRRRRCGFGARAGADGGGWSKRQRLLLKLLIGVLIVGGVVGLAVGLWWRFARLQGS